MEIEIEDKIKITFMQSSYIVILCYYYSSESKFLEETKYNNCEKEFVDSTIFCIFRLDFRSPPLNSIQTAIDLKFQDLLQRYKIIKHYWNPKFDPNSQIHEYIIA